MIVIGGNIEIFSKSEENILSIVGNNRVIIASTSYSPRVILINKKCYNVSEISNGDITLEEELVDVKIGDTVVIPSTIEDLLLSSSNDEVVETNSNIYRVNKDVIISGFFFLENSTMFFDNSTVFKVYENGYFKVNRNYYNENDNNSPFSDGNATLIISGSYGRDAYRKDGYCPANDNSVLDLNNTDIYNISEVRSDFDLRYDSTVNFFNVKLFGTKYSYHHINTPKIRIYNFSVIDSYSIELLQSPIDMDKFSSMNCYYGLSFYPPSSVEYVEIKNSSITNSTYTIKRNRNSNILLVDPTFDLTGGFSGLTPIKVCYSLIDNIMDENGDGIQGVKIEYYSQEYEVIGLDVSRKKIKLNKPNLSFVHFRIGENIILKSKEDDLSKGDVFTISNIISDCLYVESNISNQYVDPVVHLVEERVTDEKGKAEDVYIPVKYMQYGSNQVELYGNSRRIIYINDTEKESIIKPVIKNNFKLLTYSGSGVGVRKTSELSNNFFFVFCNT